MTSFKVKNVDVVSEDDTVEIDFDAWSVAKKEDVDQLRDAVLELIRWIGSTSPDCDGITVVASVGPACDKLLEKQNEAGQ